MTTTVTGGQFASQTPTNTEIDLPLFSSFTARISKFHVFSAALLLAVAVWTISTDTLLSKPNGDAQIDYLPSRAFSAQMFKAAALPMWDPLIFSGMSHIAIVQTAVFYPPNILMYVVFPATLAFNLSMVFHILLLLGFTHAYLRLFTGREEAAWLGAVTFAFCGFLALHYEATAMFNAAVWVPPLFWCVEKWIRTLNRRYVALGGISLAMQLLAGWPQIVLLSAIYVGLYVFFAVGKRARGVRILAGVTGMGLLSAGLGSAVILPTMEFKKYSNLAELTFSHFVSLSVAPQSFVQLLFPYIMGADSRTYHSVPYIGAGQLAVAAMYMGILPLMLAAGALTLWRALRPVRFAATSAFIASLLSFGGYTPLGRILFRLPAYNFFRDHRVHLIFLAFSISILAAVFAGNLDLLDKRLRDRLALVVPIGFVAVATVALIKMRTILGSMNPSINPLDGMWVVRLHQSMRFDNRDMLIAVLTLLISGFCFWLWMRKPSGRMIARVAIAIVFLDLFWFSATDQPHFAPGHATSAENTANEAAVQSAHGEPFRVWSLDREHPYLHPNLNEITGIDHIFGYSALIPSHYTDLLQTNEVGDSPWRETMVNNVILSLLNTRFVFAQEEQWKSLSNVFAEQPSDSRVAADKFSEAYFVSRNQYMNLKPGLAFDENREFSCERPPCGFKLTGLLLKKNSVYQLTFGSVSKYEHNPAVEVWFMNPRHWRPRAMFHVSNVEITRGTKYWIFPYVTGDQDEEVDIRFFTDTSSPLFVGGGGHLLERVATLPLPNPYREIIRKEGIVVLENRNVLPRAFFVSQMTPVYDYNQARGRLWNSTQLFDPRQEALVEAVPASIHPAAMSLGTVKQLVYRPNRADLEVACPGSCYLVLSDLYLPGWQARIDGQSARIYATDGVIRGLFVGAGDHHIDFVYRPKSVVLGVILMLLTSLVIGLVIWRSPPA